MRLKITASSAFVAKHLELLPDGVEFRESALFGGRRRFKFHQIECILLSPAYELSFQVGMEVFSIQTHPDRENHQRVIDGLLRGVQASGQPPQPPGFHVSPLGSEAAMYEGISGRETIE